MDYYLREFVRPCELPDQTAHEWYLNGLADGYHSQTAVIPDGPDGAQYRRGYAEGLAAAQRDASAPSWYLLSEI